MRQRGGFTLGEVLMSLSLLALLLVSSLLVLQWALRGSQRQQLTTTAAFLAQQHMEALLEQEHPQSGSGVFLPPFGGFRWVAHIQEASDPSFLAVELRVSSPGGGSYRLYTQRCKQRRSLVYRSSGGLWHRQEDRCTEKLLAASFEATDFCLSPDGQVLAFVQVDNGKPQVFTRPLDGSSTASRLFYHPEGAREPRYSPDGRLLAFTSVENGYSQVLVYEISTGKLTPRSRPGHHDGAPAWAPDNEGLVVCRDGQSLVLLRGGAEAVLVADAEAWNASPELSSDGQSLVFMSNRDGNPELYLMDLATQKKTRLTDHPAYDSEPHFSRDGKRILFSRKAEGSDVSHLYSINPDGSGCIQLSGETGGDDPCWHL